MNGFDPTRRSVGKVRAALLSAVSHSDDSLDAVARLGRKCVELLPVDGASISLMASADRRELLYASDEIVTRIEALQFTLGEGPCFEAFQTHRPVLVADLPAATITAWPTFAAEMADQPVGAIFAFPLISGGVSLGAMDLYRERPGWLSTTQIAIALQVIDVVTLVVMEMDVKNLDMPWTDPPSDRAQVHQATGMLIAAFSISAPHALARIRGYAFATGRLADEVADDLVTRRLHPRDLERQ